VRYDAPELDEAQGLHGLHQVRTQVGLQRRDTLLPPDLFAQYSKLSFWHDSDHNRAHVVTAAPLKPLHY
jgi:sulfotransferase